MKSRFLDCIYSRGFLVLDPMRLCVRNLRRGGVIQSLRLAWGSVVDPQRDTHRAFAPHRGSAPSDPRDRVLGSRFVFDALGHPDYPREWAPSDSLRRRGFVPKTTKESQAPECGTWDSLVGPEGLEPPTPGLKARRSTR